MIELLIFSCIFLYLIIDFMRKNGNFKKMGKQVSLFLDYILHCLV